MTKQTPDNTPKPIYSWLTYRARWIGGALLLSLLSFETTQACEVCKNNQPQGLENITHGTGAQGNLDYLIIWTAAAIVSITLVLSLKYLIRPQEEDTAHIKHIVHQQNLR